MKNKNKLALVILPLILSGCGVTPSEETSDDRVRTNVTVTHTPTVNGVKTEVTETFKTNPARVATFNFGVLDMIDTIGLDLFDIVDLGLPKASVPLALNDYSDTQYINVGTLFDPDYTALDFFNPDLIILDGRSASLYDTMKERYPEADVLDATLTTYNYDVQEAVANNLALIFPSASEAIEDNLEEISQGIAAIYEVASEHEALFVLSSGDSLTVYGDIGRYNALYNDFGFKPAVDGISTEASHGQPITKEYLTQHDPEIIFIMDRAAAIGETSGFQSFLNDPLVKTLTAYKNNNIYALDAQAWYTITGGFSSTKQMIKDVDQFTKVLN